VYKRRGVVSMARDDNRYQNRCVSKQKARSVNEIIK
jgi:hypothetical protein